MNDRQQLIEKVIEGIYAIRHRIGIEMHLFFTEAQITHSQGFVLNLIKKRGTLNMKELAALLGTTSSAATQIIDSLVNKGLIARKRNSKDRRTLKLELTEKADKQFESIRNKSFATLSSLFDTLDDEELLKYFDLNNKLLTNISTGLPERNSKTSCSD